MDWILENWVESIGYAGSLIVVLSLMMSNILMLRWINMIGGAIFTLYGYLIGALPVFTLNGIIVLIDIYYIIGIYCAQDAFSLMEVNSSDWFLKKFLGFYQSDILFYFPKFDLNALTDIQYVMVFRNIQPVGVFAFEKFGKDKARVALDYISPPYRDYKNANYLITARKNRFLLQDIHHLEADSQVGKHQKYLKKIGFQQDVSHPTRFYKSLK